MADIGYGATITVTDGAADAATAIPNVVSITAPAVEQQMVDASSLTSGRLRSYILGMEEGGTWSFVMRYTGTQLDRMNDLLGVSKTYVITFADSDTATCTSIVTKVASDITAPDAVQDIKVDLKLMSEVTYA